MIASNYLSADTTAWPQPTWSDATNTACNWPLGTYPIYSTVSQPTQLEQSAKERMKQEHREECRQAFSRPPKHSGRGRKPEKRWEAARPKRSTARRRKRR